MENNEGENRVHALQITEPAPDASTSSVATGVDLPVPGPGEVAIDVAYAGINFLDVMARRGDPGYAAAWPYVPGLEVAGTIRELGAGVTARRVGERVAALTPGGGFAEVAVVPADLAVEVPPSMGFEVAAAAPLVLSSAVALLSDVVRLRPGESVLMHSASGGLGAAVAQVAATLDAGARVGVVGSASKVAAAVEAGWTRAVAAGARAGRGDPRTRARRGGRRARSDRHAEPRPGSRRRGARRADRAVRQSCRKDPPLCLLGFSITNLRRTSPARVRDALRHSLQLLAEGRVRLDVTPVHGLDAVPEVHERLANRRGAGKYVARLA